jgi:hypothetical protein
MMKAMRTAIGAVVMASVLAACGGGASGTPTTTPPSTRPSSSAKVIILAPTSGQVIHGSTLHLRIKLDGARIVKPTTTNIRPDRGHIHVLLDDKIVSMTYGLEQAVHVTPGNHILQVEFVASDHRPWDPRVITAVPFEVKS